MITVAADGSFEADYYFGPQERFSTKWSGRLNTDLTVEAREPLTAVCGEQRSKYVVDYKGKVTQKGKELEMILEGDDSPCPQWGCTFRKRVRLNKQAD